MDELILPLVDSPIKGLLRWPYTLSITCQYEETWPWFYCNFIQLWSNQNFLEGSKELFFDFYRGNNNELYYNNPFLLTRTTDFKILSYLHEDQIVDYFIDLLLDGNYLVLFVDESRIARSPTYQGAPFPHHILIYGFHRKEREFAVSMYDKRWMYGQTRIPFDELADAFFSMKRTVMATGINDQQSFFYKFKQDAQFVFDKTAVINEVRDYINCQSNLNRINYNIGSEVYGLEVYRCLIEYYQALKDGNPSLNKRGITRHLNTLGEHKRGMVERIRYYVQIGAMKPDDALLDGFHHLAKRAEIMRTLLLKYRLRADERNLLGIIKELNGFRSKEQPLMEQLLNDLRA